MKTLKLSGNCPNCGEEVTLTGNAPVSINDFASNVRSRIKPSSAVLIYKISSEQIKEFLVDKARKIDPDIKIEVVPRYCEKKRHKQSEPHRSYASLRIAFSDNVTENNEDMGWYGKIGQSSTNIRFKKSVFKGMIERYQYNRKEIDNWMKSYKTMEELEEGLGMSESYLNDLKMYAIPRRLETVDKETWIIFSAAADKVLKDMLTDYKTDKIVGRMMIQDIYPISKDVVEFLIYMYPFEVETKENPYVRQILLGDTKKKN